MNPQNTYQHFKKSILFWGFIFFGTWQLVAQHQTKIWATYHEENHTMDVVQELEYVNDSDDTLTFIVLNDWMHAYTDKTTPLAKRFSDEFIRSFHLAKEEKRGRTSSITIIDEENSILTWERDSKFVDGIQVRLKDQILPGKSKKIKLTYHVKIPSAEFTKYGYNEDGSVYLKNWLLVPTRYDQFGFAKYNNEDLDDEALAPISFDIELKVPTQLFVYSDLKEVQQSIDTTYKKYLLQGNNRLNCTIFIDKKGAFLSFKNQSVEVLCNMQDTRVSDIYRAMMIDNIVEYVTKHLGSYPHSKIVVSQADYDRNPFYGLNQLPKFISPFPDEFMFEIKFLKTYLNLYLKNTLQINPRKDNWVLDGIQIYLMMKYIEEFHPDVKMMGNVANMKLLRGFHLVSLDFNGQYSYFYMLMARKNLDQALNSPKNSLIKFNEKIASKYRAGLSLQYLDSYLENNVVPSSIKSFYQQNLRKQTSQNNFVELLKDNASKKIDWFFDKIINSRETFDYTFKNVTKTKDSVYFSLKNKTETMVPISVFGVKKKDIVYKTWIDTFKKDSVFSIPRKGADKIVINYENEVPEFNLRNNWQSLREFRINNKPLKFTFLKDLEDPFYNQIIYVPTLEFNLYDGFLPGIRFHNKTILDKPFIYDLNPTFSTRVGSVTGKGFLLFNQFNRESNWYHTRYVLGGHYLHYAPDAYYTKLNPTIQFIHRPSDLRDNKKQSVQVKHVLVHREKSEFLVDDNTENYQVFNMKYYLGRTIITKHYNLLGDLQISDKFGKLAAEAQYRHLYDNNRQLNIRFFAGAFLYNNTQSNFFDFGLDRPSDYLFESDYLGRSETTGLFSQQSIVADGFFKSKLDTRFANEFMATTNISTNIWNWVEVYGDLGMIKNRESNFKFVYDSGIRLNILTDYFELYFPVYSSNGWEIGQDNYGERIRFIVTFNPNTLISLFTRKWF